MKAFVLLAVFTCCALAQHVGEPFTLLRILKRSLREPSNLQCVQTYRQAEAAIELIGLRPVTGRPESWLLEAHNSFASLEVLDQRLSTGDWPEACGGVNADPLGTAVTTLALYRPWLSYRPEEAQKLLQTARYLKISIYRNQPGTEQEFVGRMLNRKHALDQVNGDQPDLAYQAVSGSVSGTYIFIGPLPSLRVLDGSVGRASVQAEGVREAQRQVTSRSNVTVETLLFRVDPRISYVSSEFSSADADFWSAGRQPAR